MLRLGHLFSLKMSVVSVNSVYSDYDDGEVELPGVPVMPLKLAVVCCVLNFTIPGSGTIVAGVSVFCCGQVSGRWKCRRRCCVFITGVAVGIMQMVLAITVIGYILSCIWGVHMVDISKKRYNKELPICNMCMDTNTVRPSPPHPGDTSQVGGGSGHPGHGEPHLHDPSRLYHSWTPNWRASHPTPPVFNCSTHEPRPLHVGCLPSLTDVQIPRRCMAYQPESGDCNGTEAESSPSQNELQDIHEDSDSGTGITPTSPPPPYTDPRSPVPEGHDTLPLSPPPPYAP